jgi:hypothetical protein
MFSGTQNLRSSPQVIFDGSTTAGKPTEYFQAGVESCQILSVRNLFEESLVCRFLPHGLAWGHLLLRWCLPEKSMDSTQIHGFSEIKKSIDFFNAMKIYHSEKNP